MRNFLLAALVGMLLAFGLAELPAAQPAPAIQHIVVFVQENHTFDNFFGFYPGANGLQGSSAPIFHDTTDVVYENQSINGFAGHPEDYGYFNCKDIPYYCALANESVLFDNYFTVSPLASLPNHMAIIAGSTLGFLTDWNTSDQAFPWRSNTTILDEMTAAGVSWNYFNCNYNECPLTFFTQYSSWFNNLQQTPTLISDIQTHNLPDVSFVMPASDEVSDEPPGNLTLGQDWIHGVIDDLNSSGYLKSTVVLLTWDDSGGWFDHVTPPGQFGYRVPMIMLAPYGPRGIINNDLASHYSIPTVIESVFGLPCMHDDCSAYNLLDALNSPTTSSSSAHSSTLTSSSAVTLSSTSTLPATQTASSSQQYSTSTVTATATTTKLSTVTQTVTATVSDSSTATVTQTVTGPTTTVTGAASTVTGPGTTTTSTETMTSTITQTASSVPSWAYATMAILLILGLAAGYMFKGRPSGNR
jgi:phospholipase C